MGDAMGKRTQPKASSEQKGLKLQNKTNPAVADASVGEKEQGTSDENMVRTVVNEVHEAIGTIMEHTMFTDIVEQEAYGVLNGGAQAAFKQTEMVEMLNENGPGHVYKCGLNFMWKSFTSMTNHRVPINKGQIKELQRFALEPMKPPRHLPFETVIALDSATQGVMGARGTLQRMSPPEPAFAVIFSMRDAIVQGADYAF